MGLKFQPVYLNVVCPVESPSLGTFTGDSRFSECTVPRLVAHSETLVLSSSSGAWRGADAARVAWVIPGAIPGAID